jgi:hypothetical protein
VVWEGSGREACPYPDSQGFAMSKAKIVRDSEGPFHGIEIRCPGCLYSNGALMDHILPLNALPAGEKEMSSHIGRKDRWGFNGDFEKPTFTPSLNTW